jgi:iron complex outermembrane receptor protein
MKKSIPLNLVLLLVICIQAMAQNRTVTGSVVDKSTNEVISGVNVVVKGTTIGTATDVDGRFSLSVPESSNTLIISFVGYVTLELTIPPSNSIVVSLESTAGELNEVVISVGRGSQRTITDTPLPVDNFTVSDLKTTGQVSFDKTLQYRVPSFNTVNTPVNDATSLFDPYEIRNLGPSRTLILINGKRKNLTSLVYTQTGPGRGETGADLSAIPVDAIKRVEVLRDGASAQYGSDAIAGVVNIILKDDYDGTTASIVTGSTLNYGGFMYGFNFNSGGKLGKGYINYHLSFNKQEEAIRKDKIDAASDARDLTNDDAFARSQVEAFLRKYPDGLNKNGTPDNTSSKFLINGGIPMGASSELYFNFANVYRKTLSNANYRQPYWRIDHGLLHNVNPSEPDYTTNSYGDPGSDIQNEFLADKAAGIYNGYIGYQPSFEGDLNDYNGTLGLLTRDIKGWRQDMSITVGGNKMLFTVDNTVNRSLRANSPVSFKPGGFSFNHMVGNMDFSKAVGNLFIAFGSEFRTETWQLISGDTASYSGEGANSFYGYLDINAIKSTRSNIGFYADLTYDITENFLIGAAYRNETYSDFGNADVFKVTSRYKFGEVATLRGSYSTGFRAPTLHQKYLSLSQASFAGGDIVITGLANNSSPLARIVGVPTLKPETSKNLAFGIGLNPIQNLSFTIDYYSINIEDRVIYSNEVNNTARRVSRTSFFLNAAETKTSGVDLVAAYRNLELGSLKLNINLAGNYTINNELVGGYEKINELSLNLDPGEEIYNQTQESLMTSSRPKYKFILGFDLFTGKLGFNLNNTLFGPTTFNNADLSSDLNVEFKSKVVPDVSITYTANSHFSAILTIQNILNVMPEYQLTARNAAGESLLADETAVKEQISYITFNGRYPVLTYDGSHFSQMGTSFTFQLNYKF